MLRAVKLWETGAPHPSPVDTLILTHTQRQGQRGSATGVKGTQVEFQFPMPISLRTDDLVALDDGNVVEVVAAAEPLCEVRGELATLARVAWALGDRHVPAQFLGNRIRFPRDAALEQLVTAFGGRVAAIEAPFDPEGGAYAAHARHDHEPDSHDHGTAHAHEPTQHNHR